MEYRVLGSLEVVDGDRPVPLGGEKQRALLALLVLNANRVVSRERLIDDLWGDDPPETAITTLQVYVSRLRKVLGSNALDTRPPGYLLVADPESIDLNRFKRLAAAGREELMRGNPEPAARTLGSAIALWRGPALAEFTSEPFAKIEGDRLDDLRIAALEQRIDADLALSRHAEMIDELGALIAEHPHREHLREQLMLALYRSGRQAEALEAYRQAWAALDELGIEPSERLRRLERSILSQDPMLAAPPPPRSQEPGLRSRLRWSRARMTFAAAALVVAATVATALSTSRSAPSRPVKLLANSIAVIDPKSGQVVANIPVGFFPHGIVANAERVWALNVEDETASAIDPRNAPCRAHVRPQGHSERSVGERQDRLGRRIRLCSKAEPNSPEPRRREDDQALEAVILERLRSDRHRHARHARHGMGFGASPPRRDRRRNRHGSATARPAIG